MNPVRSGGEISYAVLEVIYDDRKVRQSAMHNCLASALRGIRQGPAWHYARHLCMAKYRSRLTRVINEEFFVNSQFSMTEVTDELRNFGERGILHCI